MKAASLKDIQAEMDNLGADELKAICSRLVKFKKENKELVTYLLFESFDEAAFIKGVMAEIDENFAGMNMSQLYFVKKSLRKVLRMIGRYSRYTNSTESEVQLLLYYCRKIRDTGIDLAASPVIHNLYQNQLKKARKLLSGLHEDIQYDFQRELDKLT